MKKIFALALILFVFGPTMALAAQNTSQLIESIGVGKTMSVGLNFTAGPAISNSNPSVVSAAVENGNLIVKGLSAGTSEVSVCDTQNTNCLVLKVDVFTLVLGATTYFSSHAPGTWVLSGGTVFYVSLNGLIPVSTWQIFLTNGGTQENLQPISEGDTHLPLLRLMVANDLRVR